MTERIPPKSRWAWCLAATLAGAAAAQTSPSVSDASLERLATLESRLPQRLSYLVYDDVKLRAEIKRIGFEKGCRAVNDSRREVSDAFVPKLVPATVASIRRVVPADRLNSMRVLSFFVGPLQIYKGRIDADLDATAAPILQSAYDAMRRSFVARTKIIPTERTRNTAGPSIDRPCILCERRCRGSAGRFAQPAWHRHHSYVSRSVVLWGSRRLYLDWLRGQPRR